MPDVECAQYQGRIRLFSRKKETASLTSKLSSVWPSIVDGHESYICYAQYSTFCSRAFAASVLRNPVEGERDSGLKTNTIPF